MNTDYKCRDCKTTTTTKAWHGETRKLFGFLWEVTRWRCESCDAKNWKRLVSSSPLLQEKHIDLYGKLP